MSTNTDVATVAQILDAVPGLRSGEWMNLSEVAKALRDAKMLGKSAASAKLLKKHPEHFDMKPDTQPNEVRFSSAATMA